MRRELLVEKIAEKFGPAFTKTDIEKLIDVFLDTIRDVLIQNKRVELRRFGTFELRRRPGRTARAPKSGKEYTLPDRYVPFFRPSRIFKDEINKRIKPE
ncbi:MAG TPA: integration host factor subunit beta [candidate division WOR-3 bacterium]|uniref:Integration host factor subunit beta n=1 Tax=candidate division WOR-3 bacterium TaxID=2052148 RepID=A0A9C9EM64_UNCW3|nr:integration host factor subunit beta [candidate division WOR-3 bacterium]